ncbi:heterokaryon incompatibility protein-domain-containing protein, partial [Massariosphaeria phaeospora]
VKRWLEDCMEFHQERCTPLADIKATPRRLLEITRRRWQSGYKIRLVQPRVEVEYFCLSHCWGNKYESCTTVKSNLSKRMRDIPWKKLPNLFQQALVFTHKLDAKYLWIDSLCIIQDDDQDWSREATKMAGIYENAKLTLAAIAARNSDEDMF